MRKGELFGLRWECVRFDLGTIEIKRSFRSLPKNGKARSIPLHPELAPILAEWKTRCPATPEGVVFPVKVYNRYRAGTRADMADVREVLEAAGCPGDLDRPWHAMRHTFATMFCEAGGARDAIERILGHSAGGNAITAGYLHVSMPYLSREMANLSYKPRQPAKVYNLDAYRQPA
jgi:integrase